MSYQLRFKILTLVTYSHKNIVLINWPLIIVAFEKCVQQKLERKKAMYVEKMQNKVAEIHKKADEKRAMVEDVKEGERTKVEEKADKFREIGHVPKKILCFNF